MKRVINFIKVLCLISCFLALVIALLFGYRDIPMSDLKAKYAKEPSAFIQLNGMDVHFRDEGIAIDSIPIVLIHGTGSSLHTFDQWTDRLKDNRRVIRMDLPGYGLTGPFPHRDYSIENYVDFVEGFLSSLGIVKCVLSGNSLGGEIAWSYAVKYSDKVDKLILIDAAGYPNKSKNIPLAFKIAQIPVINQIFSFITPRSVAKASVENVYADKSKVTKELVDRYFELTLRKGNRQAFVDRFKVKRDSLSYKRIKEIQQKTLVLWGEKDLLIPIQKGVRFHEDLAYDTLVILRDLGHVPMEENPIQSLAPILEFLSIKN